MKRASISTVLFVGLLANSLGCELIAGADRSLIHDTGATSGTGGGLATSSSTGASSTGAGGAGGAGGTGGGPCVAVDDGNPCTDDVCEGGMPVHTPTPAGNP